MKPLTPEQLYRHCPASFDEKTHIQPLNQLQSRVFEAIEHAVALPHTHVCVLGRAGLGKREILQQVLAKHTVLPSAWCYLFTGDQHPAFAIHVKGKQAKRFPSAFEKTLRHAEIAAKLHWGLPEVQLAWQQCIESVSEQALSEFDIDDLDDWFHSLSKQLLGAPLKRLQAEFKLPTEWREHSVAIIASFTRQWRSAAFNDDKLNGFGVGHSIRCMLLSHSDYQPLHEQFISEAEDLLGSYGQNWVAPGALHLASDGCLILEASALLDSDSLWFYLKDALVQKKINLLSDDSAANRNNAPQAIPLTTTIILLAEHSEHSQLLNLDPSFAHFFSVVADGEEEIERTESNSNAYMQWVNQIVLEQNLLPITAAALTRTEEYSARTAEDQYSLDLQREIVYPLLVQANLLALERKAKQIDTIDIELALSTNEKRYARQAELYRDDIMRKVKILHTEGKRCGEINGLFVTEDAGFSFGHPARITATARAGEHKFIDIEAEADLGGEIHTKGGLILSHFLAARYARERCLSLSASIVMEQSYGGVDGDSASLAELCALLSAIAEIPLSQSFAMTGAIDQLGNVQAVGGINEKVEGFFEICRARGLNGQQGVIIPEANVQHLMLKTPLRDAVVAGQFHVYSVETVDQAMQLLSGLNPGSRDKDNHYAAGSFNQKVEDALYQMAAIMHDDDKHDEHSEESKT